jgi:hypothetical protein
MLHGQRKRVWVIKTSSVAGIVLRDSTDLVVVAARSVRKTVWECPRYGAETGFKRKPSSAWLLTVRDDKKAVEGAKRKARNGRPGISYHMISQN